MNSKIIASGIIRSIVIILIGLLFVLFLYQIKTVIVYIIIAIIISLIANPIIGFLTLKFKFKNTIAVSTTLLLFIILLFGLIMMFVPLIISQSENLSLLDTKSIEKNAVELISKFELFLKTKNINSGQLIQDLDISSKLDFAIIPSFLNTILGTIGNFGMGLVSVLFITFFILKDKTLFTTSIKKVLPDDHEEKILNSITKIKDLLSRYFIGLLIQLSIVFILYLIVLLIFGVENAFVIAFLCSLLNIIPYIGPLIGSVLAGLLTMISNIGGDFQTDILPTTIYVLIGFWFVQMIDNNFSQPIIFSKSVNSHPLEIFLVTLISGFLFGITGMVIAIPCYTMLKVIAKEFYPENKIIQTITHNL